MVFLVLYGAHPRGRSVAVLTPMKTGDQIKGLLDLRDSAAVILVLRWVEGARNYRLNDLLAVLAKPAQEARPKIVRVGAVHFSLGSGRFVIWRGKMRARIVRVAVYLDGDIVVQFQRCH